jgi:hypothetical protein
VNFVFLDPGKVLRLGFTRNISFIKTFTRKIGQFRVTLRDFTPSTIATRNYAIENLVKIMHISKMTILSDFCMLSKMCKMKSYVKINVISVFSVLKLTILAHQGIILTYVAESMLILFKNTEIYIKNLFFKYF